MNATLPAIEANGSLPAAAPSSQPSAIPGIGDGAAFSWSGYFEALAWLCFALALLCLVLWLIKRRGGVRFPGAFPAARIESRLALGAKKWLLCVHFQGRRLLIGVTDQHISLLCELPPEEESSLADPPKAFAAAMEEETGKSGGRP
ncbi:MAG: flagellar biosynthetic protein FliO [Deltaproteobacteria bacterium]|nr:flagellar biosynthetic protein FliO [Deltaproteobacteria bacterium]